jgi:uncharacterized protein (TIGR00255 family)
MLKSMTGYGACSFQEEGVVYLVEIHSVNKKNLEISLYIPKDLLYLDIELRKLLSGFASRGQMTLKLSKDVSSSGMSSFLPDATLIKTVYDAWKLVAKDVEYPSDKISMEFIADQVEKLPKSQKKDPEEFKKSFFSAVKKAGENYLSAKHKEASSLCSFFANSLVAIMDLLVTVTEQTKNYPEARKEKLEELFKEFDLSSKDLQEKISREVVLAADRYDVTEEIHRLQAHIKAFEQALCMTADSVGRNLEFLVQEMSRETNTLGAKSQNLSVTNAVLKIKSEIEKIREQVQNIE